MSKSEPITTVFDVQRSAIEQSQSALKQTIDLQKRSSESLLRTLETAADASEQGNDLTKTAVDTYFDALEAAVPGTSEGVEELRASVHEQIEVGEDVQAESWEAVRELAEQNADAAGEFADNYAAVVDDSFDAFLEAHEQVEEQTVSAAESVEIPLDE